MINTITQLLKGTLTSLMYCYNVIILREGIIAHNQGKGLDPSLVISHVLALCLTISTILMFVFEIQSYSVMLSVIFLSMSSYMLNAYLKSGGVPSFWPILLDSIGKLNIPNVSALEMHIAAQIRTIFPGMMMNDSSEWEPSKTAPWVRYPLINKLLDNFLLLLPNLIFYSFGAVVAYNLCLAYTASSLTFEMINTLCFLVISELSYLEYLDDSSRSAFLALGQYALTALLFFNGILSPSMHLILLITPGLYFTSAYRQLWKIVILFVFGQNHVFYANEMEYPKKPEKESAEQQAKTFINIAKNIHRSKDFDPEGSEYLKEKIVSYSYIEQRIFQIFEGAADAFRKKSSIDNTQDKHTMLGKIASWFLSLADICRIIFNCVISLGATIIALFVSLFTYCAVSILQSIPYLNQFVSNSILRKRGEGQGTATNFYKHHRADPVADFNTSWVFDFSQYFKQYALTKSFFSLKPTSSDHPLVKEYDMQKCFDEMMEKLVDFGNSSDGVFIEYVNQELKEMPLILVKQYLVKTYIRACGDDEVVALIEKWKNENKSLEQMLNAGMLPDLLISCGFDEGDINRILGSLDFTEKEMSELQDPSRLGGLVAHANLAGLKSKIGYIFSQIEKCIDNRDIERSKNIMAKLVSTKSASAGAYDDEINTVIAEHYQAETLKDYIDNAIFEEKGRVFMQSYNYMFTKKEGDEIEPRVASFSAKFGLGLTQLFIKGNGSKADIHKVNAFASGFFGIFETKYTMNAANDTASRFDPGLAQLTGYFSPVLLEEIVKNDVKSYLDAIIDDLTRNNKMALLSQKVLEMEFSYSDYVDAYALFNEQCAEQKQNYFTAAETQEITNLLARLKNKDNLSADELEDLHNDLKYAIMLPWIQGDIMSERFVPRHGAYYVLIQILLEEGYLARWEDVKKPSVTGFVKKGFMQLLLSPLYDGILLLKLALAKIARLLLGVVMAPSAINRHAAKHTKASGFFRLTIYTLLTPIVLALTFVSIPKVMIVLPAITMTQQLAATFALSWIFVAMVMRNTASETISSVLNTLFFVGLFGLAVYAQSLLTPILTYELLAPYSTHLVLCAPALYLIDSNMTHIILVAWQQLVSYVAIAACCAIKLPVSLFAVGPSVKSGRIIYAQFCSEVVGLSQEIVHDASQYVGRIYQDIMGGGRNKPTLRGLYNRPS